MAEVPDGNSLSWGIRNREAGCQVDTQQMFGVKMLTDKEFWERVKNLEGKTIKGNASGSYLAMAIILAAVPDEAIAAYEGIKLILSW